MQKSVAGDVVISEKGESCRRLASAAEVKCYKCQKDVTQGRYYYCDSCNASSDGCDICEECYASGHTCETPDSHRLYVYLKANVPKNVGPYAYISVDSVSCMTCQKTVEQGPYYYCSWCGDFIMCERCYEMGRGCKNREAGHILDRYYVYSGMYSVAGDFHDKKCRFCKDVLGHSRDAFYRCTKCDDDKGHFDLCGSCYTKGAGCQDRSHRLAKYIIQ
ncbi:Zinc finger ZZ-type protein [Macrophomina phaseolina MS6]|uniref:Zinc finger ZZ-type protein n=1 Tax=Macrophomina phaseolina (strain MS6) TaxID=1126212 RepID=K2SEP1_MACPH|nr:Zinc finger ZZ-type protein [Macrophomina phaseolina MS6]